MQLLTPLALTLLTTLTAAAPHPEPKIEISKRDLIDPNDPHLSTDQQCSWVVNFQVIYQYNVVINNADDYTEDECGSGFLDNLRGQDCAITQWGCNYADDDKTMNASFQADPLCEPEAVEGAIYKAFGKLEGVSCDEYTG